LIRTRLPEADARDNKHHNDRLHVTWR